MKIEYLNVLSPIELININQAFKYINMFVPMFVHNLYPNKLLVGYLVDNELIKFYLVNE